jgi:hypothetical protein
MQPNKTNSEKPIEKRIDIKRSDKANTWISIYTEIESDNDEQKNQKIDEIIEKTEDTLDKLNKNIEQKREEGLSGKELLNYIDKKLDSISEGLVVLEAYSQLELNENKLDYLRREQKYIEEKLEELDKEIERIEWEEKLNEINSKKFSIYLSEVYKTDKDFPIELAGEQIDLVEELAVLKISSYEDIIKLPPMTRQQLEGRLIDFNKTKEAYNRVNKTLEIQRTVTTSQERFSRFTQIERFEDKKEELAPKEMIEYLKLIEESLRDILKAFKEHKPSDRILIELATEAGLTPEVIREKNYFGLIEQRKEEIWESLNTLHETSKREEERRKISSEFSSNISDKENEIGNIVFLLHQTNFNSEVEKINTHIERNQSTEEKNLLSMIETIVDERIDELEQERKEQLEGHIEKRILESELLIKRRVMEELGRLDEVSKLYSDQFNDLNTQLERKQLELELEKKLFEIKKEAEQTYGIPIESRTDKTTDIREREFVMSTNSELDKFKRNYLDAVELIRKREELTEALIIDTKLARLRSEISTLDSVTYKSVKDELNSRSIRTNKDVDNLLNTDIFEQSEELKQLKETLKNSFADIENLYAIDNFEPSPSPNGLVIGFKDPQKYYSGILGRRIEESIPPAESISNILKANEATNILSERILEKKWDGNIVLATSFMGENDLVSVAQRTVKNEMQLDPEQDDDTRTINIAIENLAINIGQGATANERNINKKERLIQELTGLNQEKLEQLPPEKREKLLIDIGILIGIANTLNSEERSLVEENNLDVLRVGSNTTGTKVSEAILHSTNEDGTYDLEQATKKILEQTKVNPELNSRLEKFVEESKPGLSEEDLEIQLTRSIAQIKQDADEKEAKIIENVDESIDRAIEEIRTSDELNKEKLSDVVEDVRALRTDLENLNKETTEKIREEINKLSKPERIEEEIARLENSHENQNQEISKLLDKKIEQVISKLEEGKNREVGGIIKEEFEDKPQESKLTTLIESRQDKTEEDIAKLKDSQNEINLDSNTKQEALLEDSTIPASKEDTEAELNSAISRIRQEAQEKTRKIIYQADTSIEQAIEEIKSSNQEDNEKLSEVVGEVRTLKTDLEKVDEDTFNQIEERINELAKPENISERLTNNALSKKNQEEETADFMDKKIKDVMNRLEDAIQQSKGLKGNEEQITQTREVDWDAVEKPRFDDKIEEKRPTVIDWDREKKPRFDDNKDPNQPTVINWDADQKPKFEDKPPAQPTQIKWGDSNVSRPESRVSDIGKITGPPAELPPRQPPREAPPRPGDRDFESDGGIKSGVVSVADFRGRQNVMWDHKMDPVSGTQQMDTVGGALATDMPLGLSELYQKFTKKDPGPIEYEVAEGWDSFKNPLNYKFRSAAWGGILGKIPIINKLIYPPKTQFGSSFEKIMADIPPFGRGWEQIVKELNLFPKLRESIKKNYPPWEKPLETSTPNSTEMWGHSYKTAIENLGKEGVFLSQDQIKRIMGDHPITVFEYENGQLKFDMSRQNLDSLGADGLHRGRITNEFLNGITDKENEFNQISNDGLKEDLVDESIALAQTLNSLYDKNNFPYTINDLLKATHICHDLGLNIRTGDIRHPQYEEKFQINGQQFNSVQDPNFGSIMKSQFTWYDPSNPNKRGVVINGETFSLDAAHELLRKYNIYFTYKSLKDGVPTITPLMQENIFEADSTARVNSPHTRNMVENILRRRGVPEEQYGRFLGSNGSITAEQIQLLREELALLRQAGNTPETDDYRKNLEAALLPFTTLEGRIRDNYAWVWDENQQKHFIHDVKQDSQGHRIRNKFFSGGMQAMGIPGVMGNPKLAREWLMKTTADIAGTESALKKQYSLVDDYYNLLGVAHRYMQKSKLSKTFWGDTKLWTQRFGKLGMGLCVVGAFFSGMPIFAGSFFLIAGLQAASVYSMQHQEKLMAGRNKAAQTTVANLFSQKGTFDALMAGPISRPDFARIENMYGGLEGAVEDMANAPIPQGSFPKDDAAIKMWDQIFGEKGLVNQGIAQMQK